MATSVDPNTGRRRDIRLIQNPDGLWTARDRQYDLTAQGDSQADALEALDSVVAAVHSDGGHEPTDEELQDLGVDPDTARQQSDELPDPLR